MPKTDEARWLDRKALATYICVRVDELPRLLKRGKLPTPSYFFGPRSPRWDRLQVDAAFEGKGGRPSMDAVAQEIAKAIAQGGRKRRLPPPR